jgi:hypothetical protein
MKMTSEPEVIADLRAWVSEYAAPEQRMTLGEDHAQREVRYSTWVGMLAAYDAIVAERDAAVRELERLKNPIHESWHKASREELLEAFAFQGATSRLLLEETDEQRTEITDLRARLAACERVVEAARAVVLDAWKQHGYDQYNVGTATIAALRAAVAAETQTTPHAGGTDA